MEFTLETPVAAPAPTRKRRFAACTKCHERKVRCVVVQEGRPCANCTRENESCEPSVRRRYRSVRRRLESDNLSPTHNGNAERPEQPPTAPVSSMHVTAGSLTTASRGQSMYFLADPSSHYQSPYEHHDGLSVQSLARRDNAPSHSEVGGTEEGNSAIYAATLDDKACGHDFVPFYAGDLRGPAFVISLCNPTRTSESNHFFVPRASTISLSAVDLEYLRAKGVFSFPNPTTRQVLLRTYFHFVHPFVPIIQVGQFLSEYKNDDPRSTSTLLLWAMFSAASNFVDDATLQETGFVSRKEMKRSFFLRAKTLYDANHEQNKIALLQAVILMGFWYTSKDDRDGPWHWTGVAISLAQALGLHSDPEAERKPRLKVHPAQIQLWRNIWWTCYSHDAWLSLALGRPMRIHSTDFDTPMPSKVDQNSLSVPESVKETYLPDGLDDLSDSWLDLLKLSKTLGRIMSGNYRSGATWMSTTDIVRTEDEIRSTYRRCQERPQKRTRTVLLHLHQLHIYFEAVIIALYKPCLLEKPLSQDTSRLALAERKLIASASSVNSILNTLITEDLIGVCQPMLVVALLSVLQVHLHEYASPKPMVRQAGVHRLELGMIVLGELRKTYLGAEFLFHLLSSARNKISQRKITSSQGSDASLRSPALPTVVASNEERRDLPEPGDLSDFSCDDGLDISSFISNTLESFWNGSNSVTREEEPSPKPLLSSHNFNEFWSRTTL